MSLINLKIRILHRIARITYKIPRFSFEGRLIEYDFIHSNIESNLILKILDVGCGGTNLPNEISNIGHDVYGLDATAYSKQNFFTFIQGDLEYLPFGNDFFDIVTAVSTLEHVGLGRYGDTTSLKGDKNAIKEMKRVVKPGGKIIITIPYGKDTICYSRGDVPLHRVYSSISIAKLLSELRILEMSYIVKKGLMWFPASVKEAEYIAENAKPYKVGMTSTALIVTEKKMR